MRNEIAKALRLEIADSKLQGFLRLKQQGQVEGAQVFRNKRSPRFLGAAIANFGCCQRATVRKTPAISTRKCPCQKLVALSNSWSTSSQPDFVRALGRRKTARNRPSKILYTELLKSWPTLGQLLAISPPMGSCKGLPCSSPLATP